ncbi:MAG: ATP-binding protein, partial [Candidatus Dormibacteraceae bacterium]
MLGVHRAYSVDEWKLRLLAATPRPNPGYFEEVEQTAARLQDYESGREVYLGVRLIENAASGWRQKLGLNKAEQWITAAMPRPTEKQMEEYGRLGQRALNRVQAGSLGARPAYAEEIRWLLRRTYWRSLPMPLGEPHRQAWGGEAHALLDGAKVENRYHYLHVVRRDGQDFWVVVLGFSRLPEQFGDGGDGDMTAGWLHLASELAFPVEFGVRYRVLPRPEAVSAVQAVTARVRGQVDHIREIPGATVPRALEEQFQQTDDIEHSVKVLRQTLVKAWPRLIVVGSSEKQLAERVQDTVDHFHDELEIDLESPAAAQRRLFRECMPGVPFEAVNKGIYPQEMALKTLAGAGALIATALGDPDGPYVGVTTSDNTPVHLDPHYASRADAATLMVLAGVLGRGKSVLAMKTIWWDRLRGASAAMVAPEGCPRGFIDLCCEAGRVNEVWLDDDQQSGNVSLDPFRIMADPFEGAQLAATMMQTLLPWGQTSAVKTAILASVSQEAVAHGHKASLLGAVRMLRAEHGSTEGAKAAADVLEFMS